MRTRNKSYSDYGFGPGEEKELIKYCRSENFTQGGMLLKCALMARQYLAVDIYDSIVNGTSYDKLMMTKDLYVRKEDFYAYRRKCLGLFREMCIQIKEDDKVKLNPEDEYGKTEC